MEIGKAVKVAVFVFLGIAALEPVSAVDINVQPSLPAEAQEAISTVLGWIYLIAWFAVVGACIWGVINFVRGDPDTGKKYIGAGILGAIILAALPALLNTLTGGAININFGQ